MLVLNSGDERRRAKERVMVQEGLDLWRQKKEEQWHQKQRDQRELKEMLNQYSPWGRPGCGAPNPDTVRKIRLRPQIENGKGGAVILGRPGGGAPHRTRSGHLSVLYKADPLLRFQFHDHTRRSVDNELRYRVPVQEQLAYRQQLVYIANPLGACRPCGHLVARSTGWTDERTLQNLEQQGQQQRKEQELKSKLPQQQQLEPHPQKEQVQQQQQLTDRKESGQFQRTGGVELVPLLTRRRAAAERHPLSTTDVTSYNRIKPGVRPEACIEYIETLSKQVNTKQQRILRAREEDIESCRRHFDTWQRLWGRPGHGAPREINVKLDLDALLRQIPCK